MDTPSASMRRLARRLLAVERARQSAADARDHEAVRVCDKLRISLTRFAGADGFAALLRRTLIIAQAEAPSLNRISVKPDCSMDGLEALVADEPDGGVEAVARSPPICSGCWLRLSVSRSRSAWSARLGLMNRWTNDVYPRIEAL